MNKKTIAELRVIAEEMGIVVPQGARKAQLIEMIEEAQKSAQTSIEEIAETTDVTHTETMEFGEAVVPDEEPSLDELMAQAEETESAPVEVVGEYVSDFDMSEVKTTMIHIDDLIGSEMNFFKPLNAKKFNELKESIKANGLLVPLIARAVEEGYEILAGHNRHMACVDLGIEQLPVRVVEADDDKAREIMIDTNVTQRLEMSPMEIARAYAEKWAIIGNRQGKRNDLDNESQTGATRDIIAQQYGKSGMTIERYMRLNRLTPELQYLVDEGDVSLRVGTEIGLMNTITQKNLFEAIKGTQDATKLLSSGNINKVKKELKAHIKSTGEAPETAVLKTPQIRSILLDETKKAEAPIKFKFELPHDTNKDVLNYLQDSLLSNPELLVQMIEKFKSESK